MTKKHREVKPVVHFGIFGGFDDYGDHGRTATVHLVQDHPRLGYQNTVYTSRVLEVDNEENPTLIETNNTIYKRRDENVKED